MLNPSATAAFDYEYDTEKWFEEDTDLPHLYTLTSDNEAMTVNQTYGGEYINLAFRSGLSGDFTISAQNLNFDDYETAYLEDRHTGTFTDLKATDYTFSYKAGDSENRFAVHFSSTTDVSKIINSQILTTVYAHSKSVYINSNATEQLQVTIYDLSGREIIKRNINSGLSRIDVPQATGTYIVKVISGTEVTIQKVVLCD
jgi:hypothetical protein